MQSVHRIPGFEDGFSASLDIYLKMLKLRATGEGVNIL